MADITIQPGLSDRDRATLIGWTNRKGGELLTPMDRADAALSVDA